MPGKATFSQALQFLSEQYPFEKTLDGIGLPKSYMPVIFGKHPSGIYHEILRNGSGGIYTGAKVQQASVQRRLDNKPSPKLDDPAQSYVCSNKTCPLTRFQAGLRRSTRISRKSGLHHRLSTPVSTGKGRKPPR
jgi:hypothetical protein